MKILKASLHCPKNAFPFLNVEMLLLALFFLRHQAMLVSPLLPLIPAPILSLGIPHTPYFSVLGPSTLLPASLQTLEIFPTL